MAFDLDMIKEVYAHIPERVAHARAITGRPLTLSEKILFSHYGKVTPQKTTNVVKITLILRLTVLLVRMRRLKWLYFS